MASGTFGFRVQTFRMWCRLVALLGGGSRELTGVEIEREREDVGKWGECLLILGFRAYRV